MNVLDTLIKLFSAKSITEIEDGGELLLQAFRKKSSQELTAIVGYQDAYELVKATKLDIDYSLEGITNQKEQLNECLRLIKEAVDDSKQDESGYCQRKVEVLCALIKKALYSKKWSKDAKNDFDNKYDIIANWKHYFLSYTNRGAAETNSNFEKLIKNVYAKLPHVDNRKKENYVAKIITRFIASNNLHGFFDEENLSCGDDIEHKIENYCQCCFAFIQLIENETFTNKQGQTNWCYKEYTTFKKGGEETDLAGREYPKKFCFFITEENINVLKPAFLPPSYNEWYDHITQIKYLSLRNLKSSDLRLKINQIAHDIYQLREDAIENLLSV